MRSSDRAHIEQYRTEAYEILETQKKKRFPPPFSVVEIHYTEECDLAIARVIAEAAVHSYSGVSPEKQHYFDDHPVVQAALAAILITRRAIIKEMITKEEQSDD